MKAALMLTMVTVWSAMRGITANIKPQCPTPPPQSKAALYVLKDTIALKTPGSRLLVQPPLTIPKKEPSIAVTALFALLGLTMTKSASPGASRVELPRRQRKGKPPVHV